MSAKEEFSLILLNGGEQRAPSPGDLLTQELNPGPLHCRQILDYLSHQGSPISKYVQKLEEWSIKGL